MEGAIFYAASASALQQWFAVNTDRSGRISSVELQRALAIGGLSFSLKMASSLVRLYDSDSTGMLTFEEFCHLHADLQRIQRVFAAIDTPSAGKLNLPQIQMALTSLGFTLDMQALSTRWQEATTSCTTALWA